MLPPHPYNTRNRARHNRRSFDAPFSLLTSGAHREGVHTCEDHIELARQSEQLTTDSLTGISTQPPTIQSRRTPSERSMTSPERKRMPQVGERRAPVFNGESEELPRFFDAVEVVAEGAGDRKSTRLNSSHSGESRMPSSA